MKVSVVIPTLNEENYISTILDNLRKQTVKPYEVIVVDGGSSDKTWSIVEDRKDAKIIAGTKPQGRQRNIGARKATGEMLLFVDADTRLDSDFLEESLKEMQKKNLTVAVPHYSTYLEVTNKFYKAAAVFTNKLAYVMQKINPFGGGCGMLSRKDLYDKTHGFSEEYTMDDLPFVREAAKLGKYGIIKTKAYISVRRFEKYGRLKTTIKYLILMFLVIFNQYELANNVGYRFGEYDKEV
ncbi:hypothetical protein A3G67_02120 [Candidatus Roizmanbacteria bacterium RIFCSPLOWO2_12_FULL_40_12]|uniref:Glycosyltransferase 2-like domain-containing protein n=1 Tax=Candidatus Roizmanbacteria bacterium RIFCSPLOWO2_01_FULL_40_42 TaxID=1802066 RepID=A0A1F7J3N4_9BACT|nr:MAG: hypothetical protein A2779_01240 [Candidatus Roizmanbacteria bacterium RIFCSPHIGHO2_01_FULL_40_98]OGK28987.1 MAG: hypothetical protein A3C31_01880 [Candidatus Roizmanbacteria bacterium RIFCSPHIGHO2_02_FULL_40_53]OGK29547.1 MAG: hypothetical protein A2W49_03660 [Candidatus Roizmanbacteria bacterium RIFCSPHIGHO2_12_41_18]OGK37274.1 MAG: hypothetical protein A3E69_04180 [Candidatus Roizmanbacteria bacterium RIFCSPHIGHO2_12_FULL_40_130]OGK50216.1 MAG: hypothetical protein A3B50_00335 [Candi